MKKITIKEIARIGIMAAAVYVASAFLQVPIPTAIDNTRLHMGNVMCLLSGMGFNGMSYNDNADYKNNWSVLFSENTYKAVFDWLQNNRGSIEEMQKFATWQDVFKSIGSRYDRIWSDEEEKQGYLNN